MTYIRIELSHINDERWIEAGADAQAVHLAALVWCDHQLQDGRISNAMARRVSLAVPWERTDAAIEALVEHGFWTATDKGYLIENFPQHAFPAEQIQRTRDRWNVDKERRRQHAVGDHSLCKDPKFCPSIRKDSTVETDVDSTVDSTRLNQTQPNQTKPDRRDGFGKVGGGRESGASAPTRAANGNGQADRVGLPDRCPHGTHHGLDLRAGSLICGTCATTAPDFDDLDALRSRINVCEEAGFTVDLAGETYLVATDRHCETAEAIARAVYRHLGGSFANNGECVDQDLFMYLQAFTLQRLDMEYVPRAAQRLQVSNA